MLYRSTIQLQEPEGGGGGGLATRGTLWLAMKERSLHSILSLFGLWAYCFSGVAAMWRGDGAAIEQAASVQRLNPERFPGRSVLATCRRSVVARGQSVTRTRTKPQHSIYDRALSLDATGALLSHACPPPHRQTGGRLALAGAGSPRPPRRRRHPCACASSLTGAPRGAHRCHGHVNIGRRHAPQHLTRSNLHQPECLFFSVARYLSVG